MSGTEVVRSGFAAVMVVMCVIHPIAAKESLGQRMNTDVQMPGVVAPRSGNDSCNTAAWPAEGETLVMSNACSSIAVETFGARIVSWKKGGNEMLWMPNVREGGRWEHGGIPVCWPWHGRMPDPQKPIHGFSWSRTFRKISLREGSGRSVMELGCEHGDLSLLYRIELTDGLTVEMVTKNNGTAPAKVVSAVHPYFLIGDIAAVTVNGLGFSDTFDKGFDCSRGDVYRISDCVMNREIAVCADMATRFVIWTPWTQLETTKFVDIAPLDAGEYRRFICVEPVSESKMRVRPIGPGERHLYRTRMDVSVREAGADEKERSAAR